MKKTFNLIIMLTLAISILGLTGCGSKDKDDEYSKPAVACIIGEVGNSPKIDTSLPLIHDTIIDCAKNFGHTYAIRIDGSPKVVIDKSMDIDERFKIASKERLNLEAHKNATAVLEEMNNIQAKESEVDYLEAIRCASDALNQNKDDCTEKTIICCGSGLGTTGYLDCKNNLLNATPENVAEMLYEAEALPNLDGISVYWIGMGKVEAPQKELSPKQTKLIENIWKSVIEKAGGTFASTTLADTDLNDNSTGSLPEVSTINFPDEQPIQFSTSTLNDVAPENAFVEPTILSESQITFVGDSAEYVNPDEALETIRPIADYLCKNTSVNILLVGSTAGDSTNDYTLNLSQKRSDSVKNTLVELGVSSDRIISVGMGTNDPWHIPKVGITGSLASDNRKVVILNSSTDLAKGIISQI